MKNIGQYNQDLSVPRKKDIDSLEARVKTNEDNIAMAESDIEGLNTDVSTLKTDVSNVKTALNSKQDTIVGAASTIVEDNLTAGKVLVSDASGKVSAASVGINDINPDGKYLKLSGGMVTGPVYLFGGVVGSLTVKNGRVTLNEGYSIGYGDGNYNFTQISGNFLISKGDSGQGVYIASGTDGTNGTLSTYVNNDNQNASTHMVIASNGVIRLSAEDSSSGSLMVNDVRVTGIADGTASSDAVNLGQLNKASLNGPITVIFNNIVLKSFKELFPKSWYSCVYTGRIYGFEGSAFIDTSKIKGFVAVGEMSGGYGAGPCSVTYSDGAVAITTLVTMDPTAPNQVKIPCLYWY